MPYRVTASGGIYVFHDREVPDTFHLLAEYPRGHSLVLSSSMANAQHIPGLIRGHLGTIIMVEHGRFERYTPYITVRPEVRVVDQEYRDRWGTADIRFPVEETPRWAHMQNWLDCIRTREKPVLDAYTGACAQVVISMAVMAYRQNKVLFFDPRNWQVLDHPPESLSSA